MAEAASSRSIPDSKTTKTNFVTAATAEAAPDIDDSIKRKRFRVSLNTGDSVCVRKSLTVHILSLVLGDTAAPQQLLQLVTRHQS